MCLIFSSDTRPCQTCCLADCPSLLQISDSQGVSMCSEPWGQSVDDIIAHVEQEMMSHDPSLVIKRPCFHGCHITLLTVQAESAVGDSSAPADEAWQDDGRLLTATRKLLEKASRGRDAAMKAQATCLELQVLYRCAVHRTLE